MGECIMSSSSVRLHAHDALFAGTRFVELPTRSSSAVRRSSGGRSSSCSARPGHSVWATRRVVRGRPRRPIACSLSMFGLRAAPPLLSAAPRDLPARRTRRDRRRARGTRPQGRRGVPGSPRQRSAMRAACVMARSRGATPRRCGASGRRRLRPGAAAALCGGCRRARL